MNSAMKDVGTISGIALIAFCLGNGVGFVVGSTIERHDVSERFYGQCQGATATIQRRDGKIYEAVGCAELARTIR